MSFPVDAHRDSAPLLVLGVAGARDARKLRRRVSLQEVTK